MKKFTYRYAPPCALAVMAFTLAACQQTVPVAAQPSGSAPVVVAPADTPPSTVSSEHTTRTTTETTQTPAVAPDGSPATQTNSTTTVERKRDTTVR